MYPDQPQRSMHISPTYAATGSNRQREGCKSYRSSGTSSVCVLLITQIIQACYTLCTLSKPTGPTIWSVLFKHATYMYIYKILHSAWHIYHICWGISKYMWWSGQKKCTLDTMWSNRNQSPLTADRTVLSQ